MQHLGNAKGFWDSLMNGLIPKAALLLYPLSLSELSVFPILYVERGDNWTSVRMWRLGWERAYENIHERQHTGVLLLIQSS